MIYLVKHKLNKKILKDMFSTDQDLLNKYHVLSGTDLKTCVDKTYNDLLAAHPSFAFYLVKEDKKNIGYFGTEFVAGANFLTGFFIKPSHRDKATLNTFMSLVKQVFNNKDYYTCLYKKNEKAINFLMKNKAELVNEFTYDNHKAVVLSIKVGI